MPATVSVPGTPRKHKSIRSGHLSERALFQYVTGMATRIRRGARPHLYIMEHMKARGVSADQMAGRLDMTRESVYRTIREQHRISWTDVPAWAEAIGLDHWQDLTRLPQEPSLDARIDKMGQELREAVFRLVRGS